MAKHTEKGKKHSKKEVEAKARNTETGTPCDAVRSIIKKVKGAGAEVALTGTGPVAYINMADRRVARIKLARKEDKFYVQFAFKPRTPNFKKTATPTAWQYRYTGSKPLAAILKTFKSQELSRS